jgi:ribosomal protein S18 acetylase RimI-like enzyme
MKPEPEPALREDPRPADEEAVRALVRSTGFFSDEEVEIAAELVREALARGLESGYRFLFHDQAGAPAAYACFGPIPGTESSYDLYWIATRADLQGQGHGRRLLAASERRIAALGGTRVWVETSSTAKYVPTRRFYERAGYERAALLADFYRPGDGKVIYCKAL